MTEEQEWKAQTRAEAVRRFLEQERQRASEYREFCAVWFVQQLRNQERPT